LPSRPARVHQCQPENKVKTIKPPAAQHPWRRPLLRGGRAARFAVGDSGRPPLRSGLPPSPTANRGNKELLATNKKGTLSPKF
jgi:hypothetical protein